MFGSVGFGSTQFGMMWICNGIWIVCITIRWSMGWWLVRICGGFQVFNKWVEQGRYRPDWVCVCEGRQPEMLDFEAMAGLMGE